MFIHPPTSTLTIYLRLKENQTVRNMIREEQRRKENAVPPNPSISWRALPQKLPHQLRSFVAMQKKNKRRKASRDFFLSHLKHHALPFITPPDRLG